MFFADYLLIVLFLLSEQLLKALLICCSLYKLPEEEKNVFHVFLDEKGRPEERLIDKDCP